MANSIPNDDFPRILSMAGRHEHASSEESSLSASGAAIQNIYGPVSHALCEAFELATGWTLRFDESQPSRKRREQSGLSDSPITGKLSIDDMSAIWPEGAPTVHRGKCDRLVECIDEVVSQLQQSYLKMYAVQAELATQFPVVVSKDESYQLAELLASLLKTAVESVGANSAAMYTLDEDTEWLAMRSSTGLKGKHANGCQRLLATSVADIEAMAGNAIVMEDPTQCSVWSAPEQSSSAVCIPISSTKTILGTLWIFGNEVRQYSDQELNILEIIAGRIAAELEREAVVRHVNQQQSEGPPSSGRRFENYPVVDPPFDGWTMRGKAGWEGDKFIEWNVTDDEEIRLTVGTSCNKRGSQHNASVFVEPLTGEFQVHGRVEGVSFWLLDRSSGQVYDICEWAGPMMLTNEQTLIATTTDDLSAAQSTLNDFEHGGEPDNLVLYLNRV